MSLDFNTLDQLGQEKDKMGQKVVGVSKIGDQPINSSITSDVYGLDNPLHDASNDTPHSAPHKTLVFIVLIVCILFGLLSLSFSLYTITHIPEPKPISIECSPYLLEKIEEQAKIFNQISEDKQKDR